MISLWTAQNFTAIIGPGVNNGMCRSQTWRCAAIAEDYKTMRFLHTMVRVRDVDESLDFYCNKLGLVEMRRKDVPKGRFTLIFLAAPTDQNNSTAQNAAELE